MSFALGDNRFKLLDEYRQLVLIESCVTVFVNESKATGVLKLVGMVDVIPRIVPSRATLQDFTALALPEDFEGHEIQKAANG
jgi:hypothetical protein